jgi:hypothetical protein
MTHIEWTDDDAIVPGVDDGIGAWALLDDDHRSGWQCIDCPSRLDLRTIGQCSDGPIRVCGGCYVHRLRCRIDYHRPQDGEAREDRSEFVTALFLHFTYQVAAFSNDGALVQRAAEFHYQFGRHIPTPRPGGCEHCKAAEVSS